MADSAKSMTQVVLEKSITFGNVTASAPDPLVGIKYLGNKIEAMHFTIMGALVVANMAKESGAGEFVNFFSGSGGAVDVVTQYVLHLIPLIFSVASIGAFKLILHSVSLTKFQYFRPVIFGCLNSRTL